MLLAQKAFPAIMRAITFWSLIWSNRSKWTVQKQGLAPRRCQKKRHVFCAGYREDEFEELLCFADHIVFNSPSAFPFWKKEKQAEKV